MRGRMAGRSVLVLALATALAVSDIGMGAGPSRAAVPATVHTVTPAPDTVLTSGPVPLTAWLRSGAPVRSVELTLDGLPLGGATLGPSHPDLGTQVSAELQLEPGEHAVSVRFEDDTGAVGERTWAVVGTPSTIERLAGDDRYETAVAIAQASHPRDASAAAAVIARGDGFTDALAGAPLATHAVGPLLLARHDSLPDVTAAELTRVLPAGSPVYLLGGTAALADDIEEQVRELGFEPRRIAGEDRIGTAAAVAAQLPVSDRAFVVSASTFPDALAASVPAARDGVPIVLTWPDQLPDSAAAVLRDRAVQHAIIVGGTAAVSQQVADELAALVDDVERVAGDDRYATAVAVADRFAPTAEAVGMASGTGFADALSGAPLLAAADRPLLLSPSTGEVAATARLLRRRRPAGIHLLGGVAALSAAVGDNARAATTEAVDAALVTGTAPTAGMALRWLQGFQLATDADVDLGTSRAYVTIDGVEVPATLGTDGDRILVVNAPAARTVTPEVAHDVRLSLATAIAGTGDLLRRTWEIQLRRPDPHLGDAGPVALYLPSDDVELVGFHQSNHDGARQITPRDTATRTITLEDRHRGTGSRTAADIVANPDLPVYAPATGTVIRAGSYRLYCDHTDHYLVIEPDAAPGWEVKMLHFRDLAVSTGQRVTGGVTRVGSGPRTLPFESQVDEQSGPANWPHVHVEVVDPSIPDRPGAGC